MTQRKFAIVTGASSGIGLEIAKLAAKDGYDLLVAADTPLVDASAALQGLGVDVISVEADLSTDAGVRQLIEAAGDRPVDVLAANAGHGLGRAFLEQEPREWRHVIDTNITGTIALIQQIARRMVERNQGRILVEERMAQAMAGIGHEHIDRAVARRADQTDAGFGREIGRASCRGRVLCVV